MPRHTLKLKAPTQIRIDGKWHWVEFIRIHDHHAIDIVIDRRSLGATGLPPRLVPFNEARRVTK
jgi:hypothetical protein